MSECEKAAMNFAQSPADSQEIQGFQYFKIYDEQQLEYILVAGGSGEDVYMVGKMVAFQIQNLLVAYKERYDKDNFIKKMKDGEYTSENVEKDAFCYIEEQIKDKTTKEYSLENVHLCILCLLDRFNWVSDEYGSWTHFITDYQRELFFKYIKESYIDSKSFNNIFLILIKFI